VFQVERLLQAKGQSFEQATIYRVSVAAAPMAAWVKANVAYSKVHLPTPTVCHTCPLAATPAVAHWRRHGNDESPEGPRQSGA
jgi:hypothetical protein